MKKVITVICVLLILSGCAAGPRQMTREEWLSTTTRVYPAVNREQALAAAEKLFRLADGDDFKFSYNQEDLLAERRWIVFAVIAMADGTDYWTIKAQPIPDGTKMTAQVNVMSQGTGPTKVPGAGWIATPGSAQGRVVDGTALYDVFWSRMDYLLGKRKDWMTCAESNKRVDAEMVFGNNGPLCNSFNMTDTHPETGEAMNGR